MPLEKIGEVSQPCLSPEHNPPAHMCYAPGVYRWTCPACGHQTIFTVQGSFVAYPSYWPSNPWTPYWYTCTVAPALARGSEGPQSDGTQP